MSTSLIDKTIEEIRKLVRYFRRSSLASHFYLKTSSHERISDCKPKILQKNNLWIALIHTYVHVEIMICGHDLVEKTSVTTAKIMIIKI